MRQSAALPTLEPVNQTQPPWHVSVLDDPISVMSYVVVALMRVLGMKKPDAERHMIEVHETGSSVVFSGEREQAEAYVQSLLSWKLNARLQEGSTP